MPNYSTFRIGVCLFIIYLNFYLIVHEFFLKIHVHLRHTTSRRHLTFKSAHYFKWFKNVLIKPSLGVTSSCARTTWAPLERKHKESTQSQSTCVTLMTFICPPPPTTHTPLLTAFHKIWTYLDSHTHTHIHTE